jgi:hypothetical protein
LPTTLTLESVLATFAAVSLDCTHEDATRIARWVQSAGSIEAAINTAGWEHPAYGALVRYAGALAEIADPAVLAERLRFEADCLTARADQARLAADEYRAKNAKYGDGVYGEMAAAREQTAIRLMKDARLKLKAANSLSPVAA